MNVEEFAATQNATAGQCTFAWIIDDDSLRMSELIRHGRTLLGTVADRYEFVILADKWTVDGAMLRVTADCIWWPTGEPCRVELVDDTPSGVPA